MSHKPKVPPVIAALVLVGLAVPLTTAAFVSKNKPDETDNSSADTGSSMQANGGFFSDNNGTSLSDVTGPYSDGTYNAVGSYFTPGGKEKIGVKLTIKDNTIQSADLTQMSQSNESKDYQARFASGYKKVVVGKKVDDVSISRVSGSSLTSNGFKDALNEIKKDAKA